MPQYTIEEVTSQDESHSAENVFESDDSFWLTDGKQDKAEIVIRSNRPIKIHSVKIGQRLCLISEIKHEFGFIFFS
jgi:hypothetical protein